MRWITASVLALSMMLAVGVGAGCKDKGADQGTTAGEPIKVGEYGAMTGDTATFGVSTDEGVQLALDEINGAGGALGRKISVIVEDDQSKPEGAVSAVQKLLTQDHVGAVIGEVASTKSIAAAPLCQRAGVPMVSPSSTNPKVTQIGDCIFRACFIDPFQGSAIATFAMNDDRGPRAKKFGMLYDVKNDYSVGLREFIEKAVKENGGSIVADKSYGAGDTDFKAQLTDIQAAGPDAIFVPGYYGDVGLICQQARQLGITIPLIGGDGWDSDKLVQIGGKACDGCYFTNHYSPDEDRPAVKKFVEAYRKKFNGKVPDAMAALGYDTMNLVADAIKRAGSDDPAKIRDALASTKNLPGVGGDITMDANRNAQKPIVVLKIIDGKFTYVSSIKP